MRKVICLLLMGVCISCLNKKNIVQETVLNFSQPEQTEQTTPSKSISPQAEVFAVRQETPRANETEDPMFGIEFSEEMEF